jgi:peptidoglycan/xylan/chitin deacetylase (PgdA/CDA1 family)
MALSLSFDDGRESQWRHAIPLLDRHGVRATFYPLPSAVREHLEPWRAAAAVGHEIGNHSTTHPCSGNFRFSRHNALEEMSLEDVEQRELLEANRQLADLLGVQSRTFAYPCGQTTVGRGESVQSYVPVVARHFLAGRLFFSEMHNDPAYCDMHQLYAVTMDNADDTGVNALLESARAEGGWLILAGHDAAPEGGRQTVILKTLEHLCRRAADPDNGIWLDTVECIAEYVAGARTAREEQ